jgi:hypothetical protein
MGAENSISFGTVAIVNGGGGGSKGAPAPSAPQFVPARVTDVIYGPDHPKWKDLPRKNAGAIEFQAIQSTIIKGTESNIIGFAYPVDVNIYRAPIKQELVTIISLPSEQSQESKNQNAGINYYTFNVSAWASVEHNAVPDSNNMAGESSFQDTNTKTGINDYKKAETGIVQSSQTRNTEKTQEDLDLGGYGERGNIRNLIANSGDFLIQGRCGNSIRMGSAPTGSNAKTLWKATSKNSSVFLIRNGQDQNIQNTKDNPIWNPIYEDINKDGCSFYMITDATIDFSLASNNFKSLDFKNENSVAKQNFVVVDQGITPISQSAASYDNKPAKDVSLPVTESKPNPKVEEEVELPDSEDDIQYTKIYDDDYESKVSKFQDGLDISKNTLRVRGNTGVSSVYNATILDDVDYIPEKFLTKSKFKLIDANGNPTTLYNNLEAMCNRLGLPIGGLIRVMATESAGSMDPNQKGPKFKKGYVVGLIQFIPDTYNAYGYTENQMLSMTAEKQLELIEKFFSAKKGQLKSYTDVYLAVFFPTAVGKPDSYVFGSKQEDKQKIYKQNPAIAKYADKNHAPGYITKGDFIQYAAESQKQSIKKQ